MALMEISENLASLNYNRFQEYETEEDSERAEEAVLVYRGDVYSGLDAEEMKDDDLEFAQDHVRILSGLYGFLRPLDRIQPYRLEMSTPLRIGDVDNLYDFWGHKLTDQLNQDLEEMGQDTIINLASKEYYRALHPKDINADIYKLKFREWRDGQLKFISFNAKKARGTMTRYIIEQQISDPEELKGFDRDGYMYSEEDSDDRMFMFVKEG